VSTHQASQSQTYAYMAQSSSSSALSLSSTEQVDTTEYSMLNIPVTTTYTGNQFVNYFVDDILFSIINTSSGALVYRNVTMRESGTYGFTILGIEGVNEDAKRITVTIYPFTPSISGDVNRDGVVNIFDLIRMADSFNSQLGNESYNTLPDLDHDGVVNATDMNVLTSNYGGGLQ
jgi:hypothetical protein